jgi:hypothetical protein
MQNNNEIVILLQQEAAMKYAITITSDDRKDIDDALRGQEWRWLVEEIWQRMKHVEEISGDDVREMISKEAAESGLSMFE